MPTMQGNGGQAVPDTKGVPVPTVAHRTTPKRHDPPNRGWARRPSPEEFTAEQLRAAGYRFGITKAKAAKKAAAPRPTVAASDVTAIRTRKAYDVEAVVREYVGGDTADVVAARHHIGPGTVRRVVRAAGHTVRNKGARR